MLFSRLAWSSTSKMLIICVNKAGCFYLHELGDVELGCPQNLDLADEGVLQGVDALAGLLDLLACKPNTIN